MNEGIDPTLAEARVLIDRLLSAVEEIDRAAAATSAIRAALVSQIEHVSTALDEHLRPGPRFGRDLEQRALRAEIATTRRIPERTAETELAHARFVMTEAPLIWHALAEGRLSERKAGLLIEAVIALPPADRDRIVDAAIDLAPRLTASQFGSRIRGMVERLHPETLEARHVEAAARRGVWITPQADGMSLLEALLPAPVAVAAKNRLDAIAVGLARADDETRTRDQLRADAFGDLLIDGATSGGCGRGVRAEVAVLVPALTLLGRSDEPAILEGHGPIDAATARELSAGAPGWTRIPTHPETGVVLSVGRTRYRPPKSLRRWIRTRDRTCRFPGCQVGATRTEIDHVLPWEQGGMTAAANLACLCIGHHKLKDGDVGWRVTPRDDGVLTWTSPSDRLYETAPVIGPPPF